MLPLLAALLCLSSAHAEEPGELSWYRGNTHTHTLWSDGDSLPEVVAAWYKEHGYHFLVLSDHRILSRGERWVAVPDHQLTVQAGRDRFGAQAAPLRRRGLWDQVRVRPLDEVRPLVEEPGRFVMIEGVEITDTVGGAPVHVNALNISEAPHAAAASSPLSALQGDIRKVRELEERSGRPVFAHVNHPLWLGAINARDLALSGAEAFEVVNGGGGSPAETEDLWDQANALRARSGEPLLWGVAADDAHVLTRISADGDCPGRGWVMVRSPSLEADALVGAMKRGDFYASTGVTLDEVRYDETSATLSVSVRAQAEHRYEVRFVGNRGDEVGAVLSTAQGTEASYSLRPEDVYVRAVITELDGEARQWGGLPHPSQAWTQPVGYMRTTPPGARP